MYMLLALSLVAQSAPATETEKWIGPVLTSSASLAATVFAYLTARDRLKYDSTVAIRDAKIKYLEDKVSEILEGEGACREDHRRTKLKLGRLGANLQAQILGRALPFPNELGFSTDDDPPGPASGPHAATP